MKKISKKLFSKSLLLFLFIITQTQAWAFDGNGLDGPGRWSKAAAMPGFWVGVALLIACIVTFFLVGREKKQSQAE